MKKEIILNEDQRANFNRFLSLCDKYQNAWFWSDNGNANRRAYIEKRDYIQYETEVNGVTYSVHFSVTMSRKNVYVNKQVTRNGEKTTVRVIQTLLEKDKSGLA